MTEQPLRIPPFFIEDGLLKRPDSKVIRIIEREPCFAEKRELPDRRVHGESMRQRPTALASPHEGVGSAQIRPHRNQAGNSPGIAVFARPLHFPHNLPAQGKCCPEN